MSSRPSSVLMLSHVIKSACLLLTVLLSFVRVDAAPPHLVTQAPVRITSSAPGVTLVDFGKAAFGNLRLTPSSDANGNVTIRFGEALVEGRVNRRPPGTVRYAEVVVALVGGQTVVVAPPANARNTQQLALASQVPTAGAAAKLDSPTPPAVLTPPEWGVVLPFRWVEIEGWPGELKPEHLARQAAFASTWDDEASAFSSSDEMLNRIWELCRYSIKATTFAGVYVDGDRERIPYEADAYLNQLSHYATDRDIQMARDTFDHLMRHPTWPTEWASHMVFIAHADWWHTGDRTWLAAHFDGLTSKLLLERIGPDGLITSTPSHIKKGDLVDWPVGERDGFVFTPVNAVANAFYIRALELFVELGHALGRGNEMDEYAARARVARTAFQGRFFNAETGLYRDGTGTEHSSLHANVFPLAFNLVPTEHVERVTAWVASRGMACSVYAAQYLMEALFRTGQAGRALELMLAPGDRSWRHMVESDTTITWEAWDQKYKPNQDWNHAWGAAPANLLPRFVLGVSAATPGWGIARIAPQPGGLLEARGRVPTPRGPISVEWTNAANFRMSVVLPEGVSADIKLPAKAESRAVLLNGKTIPADRDGSWWILPTRVTGRCTFEVR